MRMRMGLVAVSVLLLAFTARGQTPPSLTVLRAAPNGALSDLSQANEIRIVFSEPMVALGRVPQPVTAPYVRIEPAIRGTFHWSGTTILIITPDRAQPVPYATSYTVTVDRTARAVSGRQLSAAYTFQFTTPTTRLLTLDHERVDGRFDRPARLYLRFNQPITPAAVVPHIQVNYQPYGWVAPAMSSEAEARLARIDPAGLKQYRAKVAEVTAATLSNAVVAFRQASTWDTKRYPASPDLLVLETNSAPPPQSRLRVVVDGEVPSPGGPATPGTPQVQIETMAPAFFAEGFRCVSACTPSAWNPLRFAGRTRFDRVRAATSVVNITGAEAAVAPQPADTSRDRSTDEGNYFTLEDLNFAAQPPVTTYAVRLAPTLEAADGQRLGYPWMGVVENWHNNAFTSFGDGHGVWESSGGNQLPFHARNLQDIRQWVTSVAPDGLMSLLLTLQKGGFQALPPGDGQARRLNVTPDAVQSHGLNIASALSARGTGLVWAGIEEGMPIDRARSARNPRDGQPARRSTLVQVTNLGITVKDSPQNTLIFITRLDNGEPVSDARVSLVRTDNSVFWRGTTNADGIAIAPDTPLRDRRRWWELAFVAIAEKDGDVAYVGSDWNEGIAPWSFGLFAYRPEPYPILRGSVFTDRGVYRLGEEVHFKAMLRRDTGRGVALLSAGTAVRVTLNDSRNRAVDTRTIRVSDWSSAEWTFTLPTSGALGDYRIEARFDTGKPVPARTANREEEEADDQSSVDGSFLVAAYRRPDFRVDTTLTGGPSPLAGTALNGVVSARYLFGAAMNTRPVRWKTSRQRVFSAPDAVLDRYLPEQWTFVGDDGEDRRDQWREQDLEKDEGALNATGEFTRNVVSELGAGRPFRYTFEGEVEDVSRQRIAGRASLLVHPAPWYIGLRRIPYFTSEKEGLRTEVIAVTPDGTIAPGVTVTVSLQQVQWNSVRRAEGGGFYTWETERRVIPVSSQRITTRGEPVPLSMPLPSGGSFIVIAKAEDGAGRSTTTGSTFYALGAGYTAWMRYDHNRIDLVPERATYKPGETARIMIQSPWERATALVTTEREGIRTSRRFALTSTQQTVQVPIGEDDIPNVYVSVLLVKGRTVADTPDDASDPGKPSFRLGYVELNVEDASKRLSLSVTSNREEYRPANRGRVDVALKDAGGAPVSGEVTLWAVDYGVLSLTGFQTPDVLKSVYQRRNLLVWTEDNRQRIVSRRALVPKGGDDGGGGGESGGAGTLRKDFRVLAFWVGSTVTDASGRATVDVKLPESLTTYRIMAVAGDRASRFGWGQSEIRINKPVTLQPAFPRFLAVGDTAHFGSVVTNQLKSGGSAVVSIKSLDPTVLRIDGLATARQSVGAGTSAEVRFTGSALAVGRARVQMSVRLNGETDAYQEIVPVRVLSSPETVAAYGQTQSSATETLKMPGGVVPGFGGLSVEMASTALVGLGEGARYLVEYPYGCAEQRSSRTLAMVLTSELGGVYTLPGIDATVLKPRAQEELNNLRDFQCASGGFAFWSGDCRTVSPYITSYILHVMHVARRLGFTVDAAVTGRAYDYLQNQLREAPQPDEGMWPAYLAWRAFAVKVLVEGGRNQDSEINRLLPRVDRMPVFALAYLADALGTDAARARERDDLLRRINNAVFDQAGTTHVEELNDPYLMWFWNSNVRSTAIVLNTMVERGGQNDLGRIRPMVTWLMQARTTGRWGNTQENALALEALVNYYRKYEAQPPSFSASVLLGRQTLVRDTFEGRSTTSVTRQIPMRDLASRLPAGTTSAVQFEKRGEGTLFYNARLRYAVNDLVQKGLDNGIAITRSYAPFVEGKEGAPTTTFKAGDLVRVTLRLSLTQERRYVAVTDPIPAGFEPVESWFATTAADLKKVQDDQGEPDERPWRFWWERGGFEHVERHDDRVELFGTRLSEGEHEFSYIVRATTAGTFRTAPTHVEQMYEPEVFGRTATATIEVRR